MSKQTKIIITGGGTGGHVMPLMSVAEKLMEKNTQLLYIGSGSDIEKSESSKRNINYKQILSGKYRRYFDWRNFIDFFKFLVGCIQSFFIILFFWPDKVFSKGGYVGLPVIYSARILGRPIYIHETDAEIGLANKLSLKKCKKIFVSFPVQYYKNLPVQKVFYTGNPINSNYYKLKNKKIFSNSRKTILITGGSQGSRFINQTVAGMMEKLVSKFNVVHICGKNDYDWLKNNNWKNYKLYDYTHSFFNFLKNCDMVISRSGGTIFEIAYCKKPAILIPLSSSANNHQQMNARVLEKANAAVILREKGLTSDSLYEIIERVLEDKNLVNELSEKIADFYQEDAAENIAKQILQ